MGKEEEEDGEEDDQGQEQDQEEEEEEELNVFKMYKTIVWGIVKNGNPRKVTNVPASG